MKKNIRKISEKVAFECPYFKILKDDFILLDKKKSSWYLLKRSDYTTIFVIDKGYTYMVDLYRFSIRKRSLEFPAGLIDVGETPLEAAKRELEEEAGIIARKFTYLGWQYAFVGMSSDKAHIFLAEDIAFTEQKLDEAEFGMKVKKIKISDVGNLIKKRKIKSEHTINAYCLYLLNKKKS